MKRLAWSGSLAWFLPSLARLGVVGGAALALVASTESGERAGGECPAGETCAPETPDGLLFEGVPLGTWPVLNTHTIAVGGRQTFRVIDPATGASFALPFVAAVTGEGRAVVAAGADRATVSAARANVGYLRIVDGSGQLYDRLAIDSAVIETVRAAPSYATSYPQFDQSRWAAFAGGQATISLVLSDARGDTVVDEGLVMRSPVPSVRTSWDSFTLSTAGAGIVALRVDAGTLVNREVRVPVVDVFDDLRVSPPTQSGVGGNVTVCFTAWLNGPGAEGSTLVVGVPRTYRVTGPATPLPTQEYASCLQLHTDAAGTVSIEATAGGHTATSTIEVRGTAARETGDLAAWLRAPSEGERAASVHE